MMTIVRNTTQWLRDTRSVVTQYRDIFGEYPNLLHPKTFNEKIAYRKLFDRRPVYNIVCDKLKVKEYIAEKIGYGYTPHTLGIYNSPDEFDEASIEVKCVLKSTAGWKDTVMIDPGTVDIDFVRRKIESMLLTRHGYRHAEWGYRGVENKAFTEEYIGDENGVPYDYKIFCFNGRAEMIKIYRGRFTDCMTRMILDRNMKKLPFKYGEIDNSVDLNMEQAQFNEMVNIAERLSEDWDFIRVDLYNVKSRIYVGEMTAYPAAGRRRFDPPHWDRHYGDKW